MLTLLLSAACASLVDANKKIKSNRSHDWLRSCHSVRQKMDFGDLSSFALGDCDKKIVFAKVYSWFSIIFF